MQADCSPAHSASIFLSTIRFKNYHHLNQILHHSQRRGQRRLPEYQDQLSGHCLQPSQPLSVRLRPKILFLDEGTAHVDPETEHKIMSNLKEQDLNCLFVTHNTEILKYADQVILWQGNQITVQSS